MPRIFIKTFVEDPSSRVIHYIIQQLDEQFTMAGLCRAGLCGPRRLSEDIRLVTGMPLFGFIQETRLQYSYFLLQYHGWPLKAIAAACGYRYTANFSRAFCRRFGLRPGKVVRRPVYTADFYMAQILLKVGQE